MSTAQNKRAIQEIFAESTPTAFGRYLADDVRWTVIGTTKLSGTLIGKDRVMESLAPHVASALTEPTKITVLNIVAEGEYVVVECTGEAETRSGEQYNNRYCEVFRFADHKIAEVTIYCDTQLIDRTIGA